MRTQSDNKRIVSKTQYVTIMGVRFAAGTFFGFWYIVGMVCTILVCLKIAFRTWQMFPALWQDFPMGLVAFGSGVIGKSVFSLLVYRWIWKASGKKLHRLRSEEPIVPLTRQTARDISEEETLVRASSMQDVAAETVLLRPAHAENPTPKEELLRSASAGH